MVILATLVTTINCQVMYQHILAAKSDLLRVNNCGRCQPVRNALVSEKKHAWPWRETLKGWVRTIVGAGKVILILWDMEAGGDIIQRHTWHLGYQSSASHFQLGAQHLYIADINYGEFPFERTSWIFGQGWGFYIIWFWGPCHFIMICRNWCTVKLSSWSFSSVKLKR